MLPLKPIQSILIANRGEIACRIIRTCQKLNIQAVALYSDPDIKALHVQQADRAYRLPGDALKDTYLNPENIINIAKTHHIDAIHPGYGFLSENAEFSNLCEQHNIIFIGPKADAILAMAVKDQAKKIMVKAGVPIIPDDPKHDFPVIIKAAFGGGGKGMRIVHHKEDLDEAIRQAKQEAKTAFGNDTVFVEKYLESARHIEIQIFRDTHGNAVYLFERDCSTQRRHQKMIEETPAIQLSSETKQKMFECAVQAAHAIDYTGAGTIEFLVDKQENFYFMEMNTRLQVEHPVTEMTTGLDLVEWQIKVAQGEKLPLSQDQITQSGHAIEVRIYAEDPNHSFLPQTGHIEHIFLPTDKNIRIDTGIQPGDHVGILFDPLLAKIIAWGESREAAIDTLVKALGDYHIVGLKNNSVFLKHLLNTDSFQQGMDVRYLSQHLERHLVKTPELTSHALALACLIINLHQTQNFTHPWQDLPNFRVNLPRTQSLSVNYLDTVQTVQVLQVSQDTVQLSDHALFTTPYTISGTTHDHQLTYTDPNQTQTVSFLINQRHISLILDHECYVFDLIDERADSHHEHTGTSPNTVISPMPGLITKIWKQAGDIVIQGEKLMAVEAMKMEHTITAPKAGTIKSLHHALGDQVTEGASLCELCESSEFSEISEPQS